MSSEPIAVVGMSFRFPGANTAEEFWEILINRRDMMTTVPKGRWTPEQSCNTTEQHMKTLAGFLSCPVDEFDANFFELSPRDVEFMDPQHRLLLQVTWEALEDSGIDPSSLYDTPTGVFTGFWLTLYRDLFLGAGYDETPGYIRRYMNTTLGSTAAHIAHFFGLTGPNITTESGCSTSIVSVGLGMKALRAYETNVALVGSANLILKPFVYSDFQGLLSPEGHCKVFEESADGYARGEGVAVLVLKRLSDALKANDMIHAILKGYGAAQDGISISMGTPTVKIESVAMNMALLDAGVSPSEVSVLETHGTGTALGDPLEVKAITQVYSCSDRKEPLFLGSVKANIGHCESCSGLGGIIKIILALKHELIPPQRELKKLNRKIDLEKIPAMIPIKPVPWRRSVKSSLRIAGVSSFGITGTEAHLIVQEPPEILVCKECRNPQKSHILPVSAKTFESLQELLARYKVYLKGHLDSNTPLENICYTASVGRQHFVQHRAVIQGSTKKELLQNLENGHFENNSNSSNNLGNSSLCFLFSGQGSQYPFMGRNLYDNCPPFKDHFDFCSSLLLKNYSIDIKSLLWGSSSKDMCFSTQYSNLFIFVVEYSLSQTFIQWGLKPSFVLGHSTGEFAAAVCSEILSLEQALDLIVGIKVQLTSGLPDGKMLVVQSNWEIVETLITELNTNNPQTWLDVAAVNSRNQTVVAGTPQAILALKTFCLEKEIKTHDLNVTVAYHSRAFDPFLNKLENLSNNVHSKPSNCQYVSSVDNVTYLENSSLDVGYWKRHTRNRVRFLEASQTAYLAGARIFLEVGPNPLLCALVSKNLEKESLTCIPTMRKSSTNEWETLLQGLNKLYLQGLLVDWKSFYNVHSNNHFHEYRKVKLPSYPFQGKKYWFKPINHKNKYIFHSDPERHLLLGSLLETPLKNPQVYRNSFELDKIRFLEDHRIGEYILLPGAVYIEMSLAVAKTIQIGHLEIQDLAIKAPLRMIAEECQEIHTVINSVLPEENGTSQQTSSKMVSFFSRKHSDTESIWNLQSSATIPHKNIISNNNKIETLELSKIYNNCNLPLENDFYQTISNLGYNFGPLFQRLTNIKTNNATTSKEYLITVDFTDLYEEKFTCHPIIIDSMIQACLLIDWPITKLKLPVFIKKISFLRSFSRQAAGNTHLIHVDNSRRLVKLVNKETGLVLGTVFGVEFAKTNLISLERLICQKNKFSSMPTLLHEVWIPQVKTEQVVELFSKQTNQDKSGQYLIIGDANSELCKELLKQLKSINVVFQRIYEGVIQLKKSFRGIIFLCERNLNLDALQVSNIFLSLCKSLIEMENTFKPKVLLVTEGIVSIGNEDNLSPLTSSSSPDAACVLGIARTFRSEHPHSCDLISVDLEFDHTASTMEFNCQQIACEIFDETLTFEYLVAYRASSRKRYYARYQNLPKEFPHFEFPLLELPMISGDTATTPLEIQLSSSNSIGDLNIHPVGHAATKRYHEAIRPTEIIVELHACALNFKDVLSILKPTKEFQNLNNIGADFCGKVIASGSSVERWQVGNFVIGCNWLQDPKKSLQSQVTIDERQVVALPDHFTIEEGASLPTAFITAYHCIISVGKLKRGQTILIHTASGGVGLAAIQIARNIGAIIFATAGSQKKRSFLQNIMGIPVGQIYNSRNLEFGNRILKETNGIGVDLVLNSLTSTGFKETSLYACKRGGTFVEMSKLNIWSITEVQALRKDINYSVEDLSQINASKMIELMEALNEGLNEKFITPLKSEVYDFRDIRSALRFLEKAKHIGKVVIKFPITGGLLFNDRSTYIVTGGLKGIGLELVKWMTSQGAKFIVLCGRNLPSKNANEELCVLEKSGVHIKIKVLDVGTFEGVKKLLEKVPNFPPIRGVFHLAGVLNDATVENMTIDKLNETLLPKVKGSWFLHEATKHLSLDHFVLFSSIMAVIGGRGQCNYSGGNAYLDALATQRQSMGLSALSVNWGQWAQVGVAKDKHIDGIKAIPVVHALNALEYLMRMKSFHAGVFDGDLKVLQDCYPWTSLYMEKVTTTTTSNPKILNVSTKVSNEDFWNEFVNSENKPNVILEHIMRLLGEILKIPKDELEFDKGFQQMGVDSLMFIELRNKLRNLFGSSFVVSSEQMAESRTPKNLTDLLCKLITAHK